jgi:hypothetical protein
MAARDSSPRSRTEKISVSIDRSDLLVLRRRAKELYGGNLSAALAEAVARIREEEGREALVAWLGDACASHAMRIVHAHRRPLRLTCRCIACGSTTCPCTGGEGAQCDYDPNAGRFTVTCTIP